MTKRLLIAAFCISLFSGLAMADNTRYQLKVDGMMCDFCVVKMIKAIEKFDGVLKVDADFETGLVDVDVAEGKTLNQALIKATVEETGFTLNSMKQVAI